MRTTDRERSRAEERSAAPGGNLGGMPSGSVSTPALAPRLPDLRWTLSRPYRRPARPFSVVTDDGVRLEGHRLGHGSVAVVFCHGFLGWHRKGRLVRFQEELAREFAVYAFDLRGHGRSGGVTGFGQREHHDVEAVVRLARAEGHGCVVTFGASMGGIAVIGHAAQAGGVQAVVAVSTPARWGGHETAAVRRLLRLTGTRPGRSLLRAWGVRLPTDWEPGTEPADLVSRVAPIPLILVHGEDDHFFDVEQARTLYGRARRPKRLLLASRFGHAEDGFTPPFARRVARLVREALA